MSYPAEIRTLIIEDDPDMIEQYRQIFDYHRKQFSLLAEPWFAESYEDAQFELLRPHIYHLVILDLALPETIGGPLGDVMARGLGLIPSIAEREDYPVPILMIVTADPRRIVNAPAVEQQLRSAFWKHWLISKNDKLMDQLVCGIEAALEYTRVGIHIVGDQNTDELWPMLSPREEDILRRVILDYPSSAVGADLRWWSVEPNGLRASKPAWAKVLHGRLILAGQDGFSRERFLKFVSVEEGDAARKSAELLGSKLPHAQVIRYLAIGSRALLVTDKAGPNDSPPRPLRTVLKQSEPIGEAGISRITQDIVDQLCMLGESSPSTTSIATVLWPFHDQNRLIEAWSRIGGTGIDPALIFAELRLRTDKLIVKKRMCHGDLHPGNISVSEDDGKLRAYIIDAGVMKPDVWAKDIAVLEVSILLHVSFGEGSGPLTSMSSLFDGIDPYGEAIDWETVEQGLANALRLIVSLRNGMRVECDEKTYIVLLLDCLLIQIGGVVFGTTRNKIIAFDGVVLLFQKLVQWYRKLYPES